MIFQVFLVLTPFLTKKKILLEVNIVLKRFLIVFFFQLHCILIKSLQIRVKFSAHQILCQQSKSVICCSIRDQSQCTEYISALNIIQYVIAWLSHKRFIPSNCHRRKKLHTCLRTVNMYYKFKYFAAC